MACQSSDKSLDKPIVTVGDKILTAGEVYAALPLETSPEDSTLLANDFIKRWVNSELMMRKAILNLTKSEQDIEKLIEEYRRSLLVNLYQQKLLEQKYAPMITDSEVARYYAQMKENFRLSAPLVKGAFVVIPKGTPKLKEFRQFLSLRSDTDWENLEAYVFHYALRNELFPDQWKPVTRFSRQFPANSWLSGELSRSKRLVEAEDSENFYFLMIKEFLAADEYEPLEYAQDKVKSILLNKKRIEFIKQLEEDLYNEGLNQKIIKFH